MKTKFNLHLPLACGFFLLCLNLMVVPAHGQGGGPGVVDQTKAAVYDAGTAVADDAKTFWGRVQASRLKNRTPDELIAWVFMGALVGALAGMFTPLKSTLAGRLGKLLLGLAGAFLGGMVVNVARINFGWGGIVIGYEEVLFSLAGAILLVVVARLVRSRAKKPPSTTG